MGDAAMAHDRGMRNVIARGDPLDTWQRECIGKSAQLRLPLRDKVDLRRLAAILHTLAAKAEVLSSIRSTDDFAALLQFKGEVAAAQGRAMGNPNRG